MGIIVVTDANSITVSKSIISRLLDNHIRAYIRIPNGFKY